MKKMLTVLILVAVVVVPSVVLAGWQYGYTVTGARISGENSGMVTFTTAEAMQNPAGCTYTHFYGITSENSPNSALSVLLTALVTGRKVDILISDSVCSLSRPKVLDVAIGQ